jgi:hypothetical protein
MTIFMACTFSGHFPDTLAPGSKGAADPALGPIA